MLYGDAPRVIGVNRDFTSKTADFCLDFTDFLESKNPPASTKNRVRCLKIRLDFQLFRSLVKVRQVLSALLAF